MCILWIWSCYTQSESTSTPTPLAAESSNSNSTNHFPTFSFFPFSSSCSFLFLPFCSGSLSTPYCSPSSSLFLLFYAFLSSNISLHIIWCSVPSSPFVSISFFSPYKPSCSFCCFSYYHTTTSPSRLIH